MKYQQCVVAIILTLLSVGVLCQNRVDFQNLNGVTATPGNVVAVAGGEWQHTAFSTMSFGVGDSIGGVSFQLGSGVDIMVGLGGGANDVKNQNDIDFALFLGVSRRVRNVISVYEQGRQVTQGNLGDHQPGDTFAVQVDSARNIVFSKNGNIFYTSKSVPQFPLRVELSIRNTNAAVANIFWIGPYVVDTNAAPDGYVTFTNIRGVVQESIGTLKKVLEQEGWNSGAVSVAKINQNDATLGGFSFKPATIGRMVVGLSSESTSESNEEVDFALFLREDGKVAVFEKGRDKGIFSTYEPGQQFDIIVSPSNSIHFRKSGAIFHTSNTPVRFPLSVDVSFDSISSRCSDFKWLGKSEASNGQPAVNEFVEWGVVDGMTAVAGYLQKSRKQSGWTAGATSLKAINAGSAVGGVEFTVDNNEGDIMFGLKNGNNEFTSYEDITFAISLTTEGGAKRLGIMEQGRGQNRFFGSFKSGDRYAIQLNEFGQIVYKANDALFYTSNIPVQFPLYVDSSFASESSVSNVKFLPISRVDHTVTACQPVSFRNVRGVYSPAAGSLTRAMDGDGWTTGASSGADLNGNPASSTGTLSDDLPLLEVQSPLVTLSESNGAVAGVQFRPRQNNKEVMIGLSYRDNDQGYQEIAYGLLAARNAEYRVYENGNVIKAFGKYKAGDRFEVFVSGSSVQYAYNGVIFYTSTNPVTGPLIVDTTFNEYQAEAYDILWITGLSSCSNEPPTGTTVPNQTPGEKAVAFALEQKALGACYSQDPNLRLGRGNPLCYDCSGLVKRSWQEAGFAVPNSSGAYPGKNMLIPVDRSNLQVGDIILTSGHVGMYAGSNQIISQESTKSKIQVRDWNYYFKYIVGDLIGYYRPIGA